MKMEKVKRREEVRGGDSDAKRMTLRVCAPNGSSASQTLPVSELCSCAFPPGRAPLSTGRPACLHPFFPASTRVRAPLMKNEISEDFLGSLGCSVTGYAR